jgi:hypothetical protein
MNFFTYSKSLVAVGFLAVSGIASASTLTFTQIVAIPSSPTDVNESVSQSTFNLFGSIGAPAGSTLTGVSISETITETLNTLTLTNSSSTSQTAKYTGSALFDTTDSANGTDGTSLDNGLANSGNNNPPPGGLIYFTGTLSFSANQVYTSSSFPLPKVLTETTSTTGTTASYTGSGTFAIEYLTESSFTITGGGNNVQNSQGTTSAATATVVYSYTVPSGTPEPSTFVLLGGALVALGSLRNRKKSAV